MPAEHNFSETPAPQTKETEHIAALTDAILRNLLITDCYCRLSTAFAAREGSGSNWCTFATWASKQAGQTIRKEDLRRNMEAMLLNEPAVAETVSLIVSLAKRLGNTQPKDQIHEGVIKRLVQTATDKAADAISRGNLKVFAEIGREFARFMADCCADEVYTTARIDAFCTELRAGDPPQGQEYLRRAFTHYYLSFFEQDFRKREELQLLANIEIGFHEQTRLQPEITEALNAATPDVQEVSKLIFEQVFRGNGVWQKLALFVKKLLQKTDLLDKAIESLTALAQKHMRKAMTAELMTLTLPPDNRLRLGQDIPLTFPDDLQHLSNAELLTLLTQIDPTPDSLTESGATDWADLKERLHYIADLFRCFQQNKDLLTEAFTPQQLMALREGRIPEGKL